MEETATFAAGCFWGVEAAFMKLPGVLRTRVGYTGGRTENPSYEAVCAGGTGHQEAVEVVYDTSRITYDRLLETFWAVHNPTTRDRQGADIGEQYRSVIFYHSPSQQRAALPAADLSAVHTAGIIRCELHTVFLGVIKTGPAGI